MSADINLRHEPKLRETFEHAQVVNNTVLIDRRTRWGNPFRVSSSGSPTAGQPISTGLPISSARRRAPVPSRGRQRDRSVAPRINRVGAKPLFGIVCHKRP